MKSGNRVTVVFTRRLASFGDFARRVLASAIKEPSAATSGSSPEAGRTAAVFSFS